MTFIASAIPGSVNLQATLSASSSGLDDPPPGHHPITCSQGPLFFHVDNSLACEHGRVPADDPRTRSCIDHSIAILLLELAVEKETR